MATPFTTRTSYLHDGSFNEGDIMTIYRQYSDDGITFDASTETYRVYYLYAKNLTGTSVSLDTDWKPKAGANGSDAPNTTFEQKASDSLTWESGKTVRFRAWSRSNLAGCLSNGRKTSYYPDYCVADWVTMSGPTLEVPLTLKHQGCRIGFSPKYGNQLAGAEICLDYKDYMSDGKTEEEAKTEAATVQSVYDKMCMPAGIDMSTSLLKAMPKTLYDTTTDFSTISESDGLVSFNSLSAVGIRDNVQRPLFGGIDGSQYTVTIPYDMSTDVSLQGEPLVLPACTRFKVWLYDVNDGDKAATDNKEASYHIFSLAKMYPEGLKLMPGYSYKFSVGYEYNKFTITPVKNLSWSQQDQEEGESKSESQNRDEATNYQWWKNAIQAAIPQNINDTYAPEFHIKSRQDFLEFIKLVNGEAINDQVEYLHYYPALGDQSAYSESDILNTAYSFYDENLKRPFKVYLDVDIDLNDWELQSIGNTAEHPFEGVFDGQMHQLKNVNMKDGYLFGYCHDVDIRNLKIETTHNLMLLREATAKVSAIGHSAYIAGISVKAPSSGSPIATILSGTAYVVGCIYEGKAGGAMVGTADNLTMLGNMMAASGLATGNGALLGSYATGAKSQFLAPQATTDALKWGRFMVNYYDITKSQGTHAVGEIVDKYRHQEYIRGAQSYVLKAKNDNLLSDEVPYSELKTDEMRQGFYGLAPWKAMNYAIWKYNQSEVGKEHPCNAHFVTNQLGYAHTYPILQAGAPNGDLDDTGYKGKYDSLNVLEQKN